PLPWSAWKTPASAPVPSSPPCPRRRSSPCERTRSADLTSSPGSGVSRHEGCGRSVIRIDENDVGRLAAGRIRWKKEQRMLEELRHGVNGAALEVQELPGPELSLCGPVAHPERASPRKDVEIFVACRVIVGRRRAIDTENPCARFWPIGQIDIREQR